jgi:hypothetical protein
LVEREVIRCRHIAFLVAALFALPALSAASPASARPLQEKKFFGAVVPDTPTGVHTPLAPIARIANLPYNDGPVMHSNRTHVIFWQPSGSTLTYDPGYQSLVETFLRDVAADSHQPTNVYGLSGQYYDSTGRAAYNSRYAGAVVSTDPLPPNGCTEPPFPSGPGWVVCLSDAQLLAEIQRVIAAGRLPTGLRDIYFLVMPDGMGTCETSGPENCSLGGIGVGGSFCGYHSADPDRRILYAVIPFNAVSGHCQSGNPRPNGSTADVALSTISHEHSETVTDPLLTGWIDRVGYENGDLCIGQYGPNLGGSGAAAWNQVIDGAHYWLQSEWSNVNGSCQPRARPDSISFTAPAHARAHRKLTLTGRGRAGPPGARIVAYQWFFGDGGSSSRRVTSHVYRRAGAFRVTLRTTDSWDNWAFAVREVRVGRR